MCVAGVGAPEEKARALCEIFKMNNSATNISVQEATVLMLCTSQAVSGVTGVPALDMATARTNAEDFISDSAGNGQKLVDFALRRYFAALCLGSLSNPSLGSSVGAW
jgi:hypothetical protein